MERGELARRLGAQASVDPRGGFVVQEPNPQHFMASFAKGVSGGGDVFLANPSWRAQERFGLDHLTGAAPSGEQGWLMIPTGGAAGMGPKFSRHDGATIEAAVKGFCSHFGMGRVNAIGVLPLHHVSGFMAWMRSLLTGGTFLPCAWKDVESGRLPYSLPKDCCISLVPTQLQRLMQSSVSIAWLRRFKVIFVGGGPLWAALLEDAALHKLPLSPSYGATETAAMVAALKPDEFLRGMRGCGRPLPHARIDIMDGIVKVSGASVHRGYYPNFSTEQCWVSGDVGSVAADGNLSIHGRSDDVIVTGGKKVSPAEVEAALRSSGQFEDVAVVGIPDAEWGQLVIACHPPCAVTQSRELIDNALSGLSSFKHPKKYVAVSPWPRNAQGKMDRAELLRRTSTT